MNKKKHNLKIGTDTAHSKAMLRSLAVALIEKESIITTKPRSRAVRSFVERLITLGKKNDLSSTRLVFDRLRDKSATDKLVNKLTKRLGDRNSGYIRILRSGNLHGNNAETFRVSFVDYSVKVKKSTKTKAVKEAVKDEEKKDKGILGRLRSNNKAGAKSQVDSAAQKSKAKSRSGL